MPASTVTSVAEIGLVLDEQFAEPRHQSAPHRRGRHAPRGERPGGVGDGRVGLLGGGFGDAEQHVTGDRGACGHTWCSGLAELDMRPDRMQRGPHPVAQVVGGGQGGGLHAGHRCRLLVEVVRVVDVVADGAGHPVEAVVGLVGRIDGVGVPIEIGSEDARRRGWQEVLVHNGFGRVSAAVVGQPLRCELGVGRGEVLRPHRGRVDGIHPWVAALLPQDAHRRVVAVPALGGEGHPASLDLAEPHPQAALGDGAIGIAEAARFGQRAERRLTQQHVGTVHAGWTLDGVDHRDAPRRHPAVQLVDVQHPRGEVVDVGGADPRDVGGHRGDRGQLVVPGALDRLSRQCERGRRTRDEVVGFGGRGATCSGDAACIGDQRGVEQLPARRGSVSTLARRSASKNRASAVASIDVNTRKGLRSNSIASMGRNAVDTTGTGDSASRRS